MKPIRLTIAGLHSFRERQEIDFKKLTDIGMFGIFGPTGSGKSTILDAITLALYGEVGRASRKQGILNHAEKQVAVSFEFELGRTDARKRYQVDRVFKRSTGFAVAHHSSRLIELEDSADTGFGMTVLAEGNQGVNHMIRNLIGLEQEDFTRAVVLPQGRFAEFLQLTGANRNQMAERLFGLEQYGQALLGRINDYHKRRTGDKNQVVAAQNELGDASVEAVRQAESALISFNEVLDVAVHTLNTVKGQYEEAREVYALQVQLVKANQTKAVHEMRTEETDRLRKRLEIGARAERIKPLMETEREVALQAEQLEVKHKRALESEIRARKMLDVALEALKQSKFEKDRQEPLLHTQLGQLNEAFLLEEEIREREVEVASVGKEHREAVLHRKDAESRKSQLSQTAERISAEVAETERMLDTHLVPPLMRQQTQHLQLIASQWQQDKKAYELLFQEWKDREKQIDEDENKLAQLKKDFDAIQRMKVDLQQNLNQRLLQNPESTVALSTLETWLASLKPLVTTLGEAEYSAAIADEKIMAFLSSKSDLEQIYAETKKRLDSVEQKFLQKVSSQLQEGDPCPVCGATHHPHRLWSRTFDNVPGNEADDSLDAVYELVETYKAELAKVEVAIQQSQDELIRRHQEIELYTTRILHIWEQQPESGSALMDWNHQQWDLAIRNFEAHMAEIRTLKQNWEQDQEKLSQRLRESEESLQKTEKDITVIQSRLAVSRQEQDKQTKSLNLLEGSLDAKQAEWQTQIHHFGLLDALEMDTGIQMIEAKAEQWLEFDRLASAEREQLIRLRTELGNIQIEVTEADQAVHLATREEEERTSRMVLLEREQEDNKRRLQQLVGDRTAAEMQDTVNRGLDSLQKQLDQCIDAEKKANDEFASAMQERLISETEWVAGQSAIKEARHKLILSLNEERFATVEEAQDAMLRPEEQADFALKVRQFDEEGLKIQAVQNELMQQLGGRSVDQGLWESIQASMEMAEVRHQEALTNRAQAELRLDDIRVKHSRWLDLDKERVKLETKVNHMQLLKDLLRGNTFVEFMAREQMVSVARQASVRLSTLTRGRYSLELMADGEFVMRDHHNGGVIRPVTTLSGGETFLTSLALALSLSSHIQLRGKYPLEFFFLDEGFGTLDQELLDVVVTELEKLHLDNMAIGVISHVPELRQRLQRRLIVEPAEPAGRGSRLKLEHA